MYYVADKEIAERALSDLRAARGEDKALALACLHRLRNEVAGGSSDRSRMEAWIAIRKLYDAVKATPERDLKVLWQNAIAKTALWREGLR